MPRLFLAIDIPDRIKEKLARFADELPEARWVPTQQLHLTLRFIGEVGPQTYAALRGALARFSFGRFALELRGTGHFSAGKQPRVLWVGVQPGEALGNLHEDLERALIDPGIAPGERPFSPHLTLARLKDTVPARVRAFELRHERLAFPTFEVCEIVLYSSVLTSQGPLHTREAAVRCTDAVETLIRALP